MLIYAGDSCCLSFNSRGFKRYDPLMEELTFGMALHGNFVHFIFNLSDK
jgi:hypothetical protein